MMPIPMTGLFLVLLSAGSGGESAVDLQTRAGDEGRFGTGEIGNHAGDLVALSIALEGDQAFHLRREGPSAGFMSVSTGPGCTLLTVMPRGPRSRARPRVKLAIAPLVKA